MLRIARAHDLGDRVLHIPGRQELPLLDLDNPARLRRRDEQVRLPAKEGGDLQHVDHRRHTRAVLDFVHIGHDGKSKALADLGEHGQCRFEADAALARQRGPVGFVVGRFVDEPDAELGADFLERARHLECVCAAFHLARTSEHRDRRVVGERYVARCDTRVGFQCFLNGHGDFIGATLVGCNRRQPYCTARRLVSVEYG